MPMTTTAIKIWKNLSFWGEHEFSNYKAPSLESWTGRLDSPTPERFYQVVKLLNLNSPNTPKLIKQPGVALIGFVCDAGIRRNWGRPGAQEGPQAFRKIFGNLAITTNKINFYDLGDISCPDNHVESAQEALSKIVSFALDKQLRPIIIGGGHEVSLGGYLGASSYSAKNIGIINFDAHFDLRSVGQAGSHSGNSFSQIASWCENNNRIFDYLVLGIQPAANTLSLYEKAKKLKVSFLEAEYLFSRPEQAQVILEKYLMNQSHVYVSVCMDVFAQALAPGVSAPQSLGLWPQHVLTLLNQIIDSGKLTCLDIAEYSPPLDSNNQTGKLCASIVHTVLARIYA